MVARTELQLQLRHHHAHVSSAPLPPAPSWPFLPPRPPPSRIIAIIAITTLPHPLHTHLSLTSLQPPLQWQNEHEVKGLGELDGFLSRSRLWEWQPGAQWEILRPDPHLFPESGETLCRLHTHAYAHALHHAHAFIRHTHAT